MAIRRGRADRLARYRATAHWDDLGGSSLNGTWRLEIGARALLRQDERRRATGDAARRKPKGLRALACAGAVRVPAPVACGSRGRLRVPCARMARFRRAAAAMRRSAGAGAAAPDDGGSVRLASRQHDRHDAAGQCAGPTTGRRSSATGGSRRNSRSPRATATAAGCSATASGCSRRSLSCSRATAPAPSLLHGDLWSGNAARLASGEPVVFDPAVYFGDREADLAMTELFGGFGADFYAAYRAAWPLDAGYPVAPHALQPLPRAQPPQSVRRRLRRTGGGNDRATPRGGEMTSAIAAAGGHIRLAQLQRLFVDATQTQAGKIDCA